MQGIEQTGVDTVIAYKRSGNFKETVIPERDGAPLIEVLSGFLASTYVLYHKSLYYHWNVTGSNFFSLRRLFEYHYQDMLEAADEIAERIRALGYFSAGTLAVFVEAASVPEDRKLPESDYEMIENLMAGHHICAEEARHVLRIAQVDNDTITADIMTRRIRFHDNAMWMLRALQM